MEAKTFEVRDRGTFVPILAVKLVPGNEADRYLLSRAGYGPTRAAQAEYVQVIRIDGGEGKSDCDPTNWSRTLQVAHQFILQHWKALESGDVIDVEYILGETRSRKVSECLEVPA